ncbi:hypothetical protein QBC35DRAFT_251961 [Podospora australis]|uniref:Uncharacterized protein n=1 Tax=Podospora australis TaxID=1536484 RepID=A0AAN7AI84_9PEZI|nr:hypothetical protein QBC35DRAFT_251961 [Podospora australis]
MAPRTDIHGRASAATIDWSAARSFKRAVAALLVGREDDKCSPQPGINLCEKPSISSVNVTWIVVGTVLGVLAVSTIAILLFFHIRRQKRDKKEDETDRFQMSDYGLDEVPSGKSRVGGGGGARRNDEPRPSPDGSPSGYGRRSRDPLDAPREPKYMASQLNGHLNPNPFDDAVAAAAGPQNQWPKRDTSHKGSPPQVR